MSHYYWGAARTGALPDLDGFGLVVRRGTPTPTIESITTNLHGGVVLRWCAST